MEEDIEEGVSPNPDHEMDIVEAMSTTELRDAEGNLIDPATIVVDPDWLANFGDEAPTEENV